MAATSDLCVLWPLQDHNANFVHRLDIVFVHGLNPKGKEEHGARTWTAKNGRMWPKDLLPSVVDYARVMLFTYNSNVTRTASEIGFRGHAESLLDSLQGIREDTNTVAHPIIFIGHSLGGLLIKQALVLSKQNDRVYKTIVDHTRGVTFFGTPHRGGNGATLGDVAANAVSFLNGSSTNDLMQMLRRTSMHLAHLSADFAHQYEDYQFLTVVESRPLFRLPMMPIRTVVVDRESAVLGLSGHRETIVELDRYHGKICKFEEHTDPDYKRVARHLKRMADRAVEPADRQGSSEMNTSLVPQTAPEVREDTTGTRLVDIETKSDFSVSRKYSTLDPRGDLHLIGQRDMVAWVEYFLKQSHETYLLIHGAVGTGKSSIAYEVASQYSQMMSVFWFSAESPSSIGNSFEYISKEIKDGELSSGQQRQQHFRSWLSNKHRGPWVAIFDNAYSGLDLRGMLPNTTGKVIITARHTNIFADRHVARREVPPLQTQDAADLLLSINRNQQPALAAYQPPSQCLDVVSQLADRPLAIVFAGICVKSSSPSSIGHDLQLLADEDIPGSGTLDPKLWKWIYHVLEGLGMQEKFLLGLFCVFDWQLIPDAFVEFLADGAHHCGIFQSRQYAGPMNCLLTLRLVRRRRKALVQYYYIPLAVKECMIHYLTVAASEDTSLENVLKTGCDLLSSALHTAKGKSAKTYIKSLEISYSHTRSICRAAKTHNVQLGDSLHPALSATCRVALSNTTRQPAKYCFKQFWKTWLLNNNFPLNEANTVEGDSQIVTVQPSFPSWVLDRPLDAHQRTRIAVAELLVPAFIEDMRECIIVAAVGQAWHGIREDVFKFARAHPDAPRDETPLNALINRIDKGACEGLQSGIARTVASLDYSTEAGMSALEIPIDIITAAIAETGVELANFDSGTMKRLQEAVATALEPGKMSSFFQMCGAFEVVLRGSSFLPLVTSVIGPTLCTGSEAEGLERIMSFVMDQVASERIKEQAFLVSRGYWEVFGALGHFLAVDILRELSTVIEDACTLDMRPATAPADILLSSAITIAREAIMAIDGKNSVDEKSVFMKAAFWCVQAEGCMGECNGVSSRSIYRNQDRWEEYLILSGSTGDSPIVAVV